MVRFPRNLDRLRQTLALASTMGVQGGKQVKKVKILALTKYGRLGASSRIRLYQLLEGWKQDGIEVTVRPLISDRFLQQRYRRGRYSLRSLLSIYFHRVKALVQRQRYDLLWIEKEALPWCPLCIEIVLLRGVPYVLDYDDATFHSYDHHPRLWVRRLLGRRIDGLMSGAALVIAGNSYLAQRAREAGAHCVEIVPTAIDLERYPAPTAGQHPVIPRGQPEELPRIVWIGSPATVHYLQLLQEPLKALAATRPFMLRVIGASNLNLPGVMIEELPWSEETEVRDLVGCSAGIMPLHDSLWEQGKCGYKLIQYMACGIPVVASRVGANNEIVKHGENGFLATSHEEWICALDQLLTEQDMRINMSLAGRADIERIYCIQQTGPTMSKLLWALAEGGARLHRTTNFGLN